MKVTRKLARMVENKIRHGMATGSFQEPERSLITGPLPRPAQEKSSGSETDRTK
jgi:hypothetical protein